MADLSVTIWNRVEARPRSLDIDRALRSEIRDPMWMLSRQWQFGEFLAEDSGSLVSAKAGYRVAYLDKISDGSDNAKSYDDQIPLEANVEKQPPLLDLNLRLQTGRHWLRLVKNRFSTDKGNDFITKFKADKRLHFRPPRDKEAIERYENANLLSKQNFFQMIQAVAGGRMIDGVALYLYLKQNSKHFASDFLDQRDDDMDQLGGEFIIWLEQLYGPLDAVNPAWQAAHLEHQFDCSIQSPEDQSKVLSAKEYNGGRLDWYSFDYADAALLQNKNLLAKSNKGATLPTAVKELLPAPASYPGMPSARFWEIEDGTINFGDVQAFSTDSAKMVFTQFGLLYSNDWLTFPLELPFGCHAQIDELLVTDVFGQRIKIPHVHEQTQNEFWGYFQLHDLSVEDGQQNDSWLLLAPVAGRVHSGKEIEKIVLIRDEMANMVWAIENIIADELGGGIDGYEHAQKIARLMQSLIAADEIKEPIENEATLKYSLVNTVPDNWIPFIPIKKEQDPSNRDTQLQRAAMPRIVPGFPPRRVRPNTTLLQDVGFNQPYYIFEEEVPRSGAVVSSKWKRTRWHNGDIVLWLGREKTNGRGEKSSGLRFDFVKAKQ